MRERSSVCATCKYAVMCLPIPGIFWVCVCPGCNRLFASFAVSPPFGEPRAFLEDFCPKAKQFRKRAAQWGFDITVTKLCASCKTEAAQECRTCKYAAICLATTDKAVMRCPRCGAVYVRFGRRYMPLGYRPLGHNCAMTTMLAKSEEVVFYTTTCAACAGKMAGP